VRPRGAEQVGGRAARSLDHRVALDGGGPGDAQVLAAGLDEQRPLGVLGLSQRG
jgi:hypothetical protein